MQDLEDWRRSYRHWLFEIALPLWHRNGVDRQRGGFQELLGQDGQPVLAPRRARVQARQSFVFARSGKLGWKGPWQDVVGQGLVFLDRHYRGHDGLYVTLCAPNGEVINDVAMTYDQAFALLAAASLHAHQPQRPGWREYALDLLARLRSMRGHPGGGFVEAGARRFLSNPHMHLLEAALAWIEADGGAPWQELADEIVVLALDRFIDPDSQVLREFFVEDWRPMPGDAGQVVEPGHQFEWAWLLERWARLRGDTRAHNAALDLFAAGKRGIDPAHNLALDEIGIDHQPRRATARLWPQTERLKAACILGKDEDARAAAAGLWRYLETPFPGVWRDRMREDGEFVDEPAPASSLYHVICAVASLQGEEN
jgi:mannose-1-phosphate guanylyltransferase/mannose-6-phosphate isomerase